jgi:hypothetical protein
MAVGQHGQHVQSYVAQGPNLVHAAILRLVMMVLLALVTYLPLYRFLSLNL